MMTRWSLSLVIQGKVCTIGVPLCNLELLAELVHVV